MSTNNLNQGT